VAKKKEVEKAPEEETPQEEIVEETPVTGLGGLDEFVGEPPERPKEVPADVWEKASEQQRKYWQGAFTKARQKDKEDLRRITEEIERLKAESASGSEPFAVQPEDEDELEAPAGMEEAAKFIAQISERRARKLIKQELGPQILKLTYAVLSTKADNAIDRLARKHGIEISPVEREKVRARMVETQAKGLRPEAGFYDYFGERLPEAAVKRRRTTSQPPITERPKASGAEPEPEGPTGEELRKMSLEELEKLAGGIRRKYGAY